MPSPNVALVQRLFEVYNERSFAENVDLIGDDIVWDVSRLQLPDADSYAGRSELRGFIEAWEEGFEFEHVEALEFTEEGDRVIVTVRHRGRGKSSHADVVQHFAMVWTVRDGRAVRMDLYPDLDAAVAAAGVSRGQG